MTAAATGEAAPGAAAGKATGRGRGYPFRRPALLVAFLLVLLLPMSKGTGSFRCPDCGSRNSERWLSWGIRESWFTFWRSDTVAPSRAYEDLFDEAHGHRWPLGSGKVEGIFGVNTPVSGGVKFSGVAVPNDFARAYEDSEEFRTRIQEKIESREVTREEVRRLIGLPAYSNALYHRLRTVPPGTHALVRRAREWLGEDLWPPPTEHRPWPPEAAE